MKLMVCGLRGQKGLMSARDMILCIFILAVMQTIILGSQTIFLLFFGIQFIILNERRPRKRANERECERE